MLKINKGDFGKPINFPFLKKREGYTIHSMCKKIGVGIGGFYNEIFLFLKNSGVLEFNGKNKKGRDLYFVNTKKLKQLIEDSEDYHAWFDYISEEYDVQGRVL